MTAPKYYVKNVDKGWSVTKENHHDLGLGAFHRERSHLGLAETLSEAVLIAQEDAGDQRALTWSWGDDFTHGEGQ